MKYKIKELRETIRRQQITDCRAGGQRKVQSNG